MIETEVLIVGAGPAGATAAALLSSYGIDNIMLNKHGSVAVTPRAHITNQRSMEVFRDLDIEDQVVAQATPQHKMGDHVWATSLTGQELGRLRTWYNHPHFKAEHDLASPCSICDMPQHLLEPILVSTAAKRGTTVRLNAELVEITQDDDGVTGKIRDRVTETEYEVRARYAIGADGGNSVVAKQIGLQFDGWMGAPDSYNVVFKADLSRFVEHRQSDMYWFVQPGAGHNGVGVGVLRMIRPWHTWVGVWGFDPKLETPDYSEENARNIAHRLIGDDSVEVEIDSIYTWGTNSMVATDNMLGRIFCVGDAVHRHSPMNGLGSNTSVQDSYNLCWKLAMVLRGGAKQHLLESYREERLPVARQIVDRATRSIGLLPGLFEALDLPPVATQEEFEKVLDRLESPGKESGQMRKAFDEALAGTLLCFNTHGVEMNQSYQSDAIIEDELSRNSTPSRDEEIYYYPAMLPGRHVPHVYLTRNQEKTPLVDLCGHGDFTLLIGIGGAEWRRLAADIADRFDIRINVHSIGRGCDYEDSYRDFRSVADIEEEGAILVRPDAIVAWRMKNCPDDAENEFTDAVASILGHA